MKKKNLMALTMACALSIGALAGCGSGGADTGGKQDSGTAGTNDTSASVADNADTPASGTDDAGQASPEETVTLKWIQVGNGMPANYDAWLEQINPYLEEKIGVNVDMEIVPWADWDNRRSVITNSGEAFDILFTDAGRYNSEVNTGVFMDITTLVKEASPELYAMIPEDYWKAASVGGKVYAVPTYKDSSATNYFIWDVDMAEKYDIDYKGINNYADLAAALKTIKEGEGGAPYYMSKNGADYLISGFDQLGAGLPVLGVKYDDETKTVVNPLEDEEVIEQLGIIHQMYVDGIINGDAPTADDSNGYRTFFTAQGWSGAAKSNWGPNNGIENCEAVKFGNTLVSNTTVRGSLNGIYAGCKNPEKALQLLELVNTDSKIRDLFYYGVEGENFVYTADNKVEKLNTDWSMAGYTQGTFFNVTQLAEVEINEWDEVKELNAQAAPSVMLGFDMDTSEVETELANCRAVYEKYKSELWTGAQDPAALLPTLMGELEKAGWEKIRETAQAQVDAVK